MSDEKKNAPVSDAAMAAAVKYVSEQMIPAAVAAAVAATAPRHAPAQVQARPNALALPNCPECGQKLVGCEGKHTMMSVFPKTHAEYFPGVILNGIKYLSNDLGHQVLVPDNAAASIQAIVDGYERNERELSEGRKAFHQSGSVSPSGMSVRQATAAWR